jgi:ribonuclease G
LDKELIIQSSSEGADIALSEGGRLVEFHHEKVSEQFAVGDIYLGTVKKILHGLNAAFVSIGHSRDAFLHYLDLGPNVLTQNKFVQRALQDKHFNGKLEDFPYQPEIDKNGNIGQVLKPNQKIIVQIVKEPISTKGPRLSSQLSIAGRYIVLMPFSNSISISKKVSSKEERERLNKLMKSIKPANFGVILRTVAEGKSVADLDQDLRNLVAKWYTLVRNLKRQERRLLGEMDKSSSIVRDILNDSFTSIVVDDSHLHEQLRNYITKIAPDKTDIVKYQRNTKPLFQTHGIDRQIKGLFGKTVNLPSGAYLVIEHTEALHVIDVNSGSKRSKEQSQEENALRCNLDAAEEIARQLRLRDMGGIIVVDFIDLKQPANRRKLFDHIVQLMKSDRAKHTILPLSKFGLMQITRQRVKPEVNISTAEVCPVCKGTGEVTPMILVTDQIENAIQYHLEETGEFHVTVRLHPYVHAYLTKGLWSRLWQWRWKHRAWIKLEAVSSYQINQFTVLKPQATEEEAKPQIESIKEENAQVEA